MTISPAYPLYTCSWQEVDALIAAGEDPNTLEENSCTPLFMAVFSQDLLKASRLLHGGANPDLGNSAGLTPLHLAVRDGHDGLAEILIRHKANTNAQSMHGVTPLMEAARGRPGQPEEGMEDLWNPTGLAEKLLRSGADPSLTDNMGQNALMYAAANAQPEITALLIAHGANILEVNAERETALDISLFEMQKARVTDDPGAPAIVSQHVKIQALLKERAAEIKKKMEDAIALREPLTLPKPLRLKKSRSEKSGPGP